MNISIKQLASALINQILTVGTVAYLIYQGGNELFNTDIHVTAPQGIETEENGKYVVYNGETYQFNEKVTNVLCIGVDKRNLDENNNNKVKASGGQADVLMLVSIDTSNGKITLFNISRDSMVDVTMYSAGGAYAGTEKQQICLSYSYGDGKESSCENTVNSVQRLFYNIPIGQPFAYRFVIELQTGISKDESSDKGQYHIRKTFGDGRIMVACPGRICVYQRIMSDINGI